MAITNGHLQVVDLLLSKGAKLDKVSTYVTGPAKINHVSAKKSPIFPYLLYHNLRTVCTNTIKSLSLLQNLMGFLLKFTEMGYHVQS